MCGGGGGVVVNRGGYIVAEGRHTALTYITSGRETSEQKKKKSPRGNKGRAYYVTLRDAGSPLLRGAICRVALAVSLFSLLLWGSVLNPIAKQRAPNNIRREHHVHVITVRRLKDPHALLTRSIPVMPSYRTLVTAPAPLREAGAASAIYSGSRAILNSSAQKPARKTVTVAQLSSFAVS